MPSAIPKLIQAVRDQAAHLPADSHTHALTKAIHDLVDHVDRVISTLDQEKDDAIRALEKSEASYRTLFEAAAIGKTEVDAETGRILRVNRKFCEMVGYAVEELIGHPFSIITHPDDRAQSLTSYQAFIRGGGAEYRIEKRYVRKDGTTFWGRVTASVVRDADGRPMRTIAIIEDITEQREAQLALLESTGLWESERRLRDLVDHLPTGAVFVEGPWVKMNKAAERITGYRRDELTTLDAWFNKLYPNNTQEVRSIYETDKAAGFPQIVTVPVRHKDGSTRTVEFGGYASEAGEIWVLHDVTERETAEIALREREQQYRLVTDSMRDMVALHAP